jgi:general stress protein YciG
MRFGDLVNKAKKVVDQRGGTEALKQDAEELKDIARGGGSTQDKAKRAADALKDPGAPGSEKHDRAGDRAKAPRR